MRYGIFGDVHANLPALEAVVAALESEQIDRWLCLGDIVGYGADPAACIDKVRELSPAIVGGNHDWGTTGRLSLTYFNPVARTAIEWTRSQLSRENMVWLDELPLLQVADDITLAHATLHDPHLFDYLVTPYDAWLSFRHMTTSVAVVGHSHVPVTFFDGNPVVPCYDQVVEIEGRRAISNVGSVGQPRDGNPLAAYGIYDDSTHVLQVERVPYDVDEAAARIRSARLPPILAERLHLGR